MKILVIGSGGREHALVWKLRQSPRVTELFCAPGNAGIAEIAECVPIGAGDSKALMQFAAKEGIGLTVVGPDEALAGGIVDLFRAYRLRIFGPKRAAARLEWSKGFAKGFMRRNGIPMADSVTFDSLPLALAYLEEAKYPLVVKADGLALGKGVVIAGDFEEAALAVREMMVLGRFGEAGKRVVVEDFLVGEECSIHALVDGRNFLLFPGAQDHKRALDGDLGPMTGGMGTFSPPSRLLTPGLMERIEREILRPFVAGARAEGLDFRGMLFPGLMITSEGPKVLEFNVRFGDPETQVLLPRLESDLVELLEATINGKLASVQPVWRAESAVCVVMASGGYPGEVVKGLPIRGLGVERENVLVFHAGTKLEHGEALTAGGRVLGVTALAGDLAGARALAYEAVAGIEFEGAQFRRDIGAKGLDGGVGSEVR